MKYLLVSLLVLFLAPSITKADAIVPENVLKSWGYESTDKSEKWHAIKRIKGERWENNQIYYPRFVLSKSCYLSDKEASAEQERVIEEHKNDPFKGFKSHYNSFVFASCLYSISTAARVTFLEHQPEILKKYMTYIKIAHNK